MPAEAREVWGSSFMCVIELRSDSKLSKLSKSPMSHWENIQGEGIKLWRYWIVPIPHHKPERRMKIQIEGIFSRARDGV